MINTVIKRNGKEEKYNNDKIAKAVMGAASDIKKDIDLQHLNLIVKDVESLITKEGKSSLSVEEIQNKVEESLMALGYFDVAKAYILYREERRKSREMYGILYEELKDEVEKVLSNKNVENSNANVDEKSFSGKNNKALGAFMKEYALNYLMDSKVANAHRQGDVYTHDLDNYASGCSNCSFIDFDELFGKNNGFSTRNGDVRRPNSIGSFFQLVAVVFQCQSQVQYGGCASGKIDYEAATFVRISFRKAFKSALIDLKDISNEEAEDLMNHIEKEYGDIIKLENEKLKDLYPREYKVAERHTIIKTKQGAESLYHNLNTLESRAGSQVPFTSINFGTDTTPEGRLVTKSLLEASIDGIGKLHRTSIFPISIFKYKKGINDKPGTPNYDLYQLAIKSLSKRIYPNIVNCDFSLYPEATCPAEEMMTMGCRTMLGYDRHGLGYNRMGRGNITPVTVNLPMLGVKHGICLGERETADLEGFYKDFYEQLQIAEKGLMDRWEWIASQKAGSGYFAHANGIFKNTLGRKLDMDEEVRESMKHGTLALGYCGLAECCKALFGKTHGEDDDVYKFALDLITRIKNYCEEASERNDMNFSCYATPAESTCMTFRNKIVERYGVIEGVSDREYVTNSHHIPVYQNISIIDKLKKEAPFGELATAGNITYVEIDSSITNNPKAIEKIINTAMKLNVPYLAINFPIDTCMNCGYSGEINEDDCPACHGSEIERLRRVTGYITTDYSKFNKGKIAEVNDRVKHSMKGML